MSDNITTRKHSATTILSNEARWSRGPVNSWTVDSELWYSNLIEWSVPTHTRALMVLLNAIDDFYLTTLGYKNHGI